MVIREDRNELIEIINEYLHEEITSFEISERIDTLIDSKDETVSLAAEIFWGCYDDFTNHTVDVPKEGWDYLQRLLLILSSEASIETEKRRYFHFTQIFALLLFILTAIMYIGCYYIGIWLALLFWPIAIIFHKLREQKIQELYSSSEWRYQPFSSPSSILKLHRLCYWFKKEKYPKHLDKKNTRSVFMANCQMYLLWILFLPIVFLFQAFPLKAKKFNVIGL